MQSNLLRILQKNSIWLIGYLLDVPQDLH